MNNKILKRIFNILIILILFFNIDNVKAADSEVVAKITPTICEWENGANYIPTGGLGVSEDYQPFFGLSFNGIYYCASNSSDGDMNILNIGGHGTYFLLNPNPTKKIFFPVIYWDKKNYSNDSRLALSLHPITAKEHKTFNEEKQEIFNNVSKANSKYAYEECKKYCNSCHLTENGYAYYCNDYNLKKNVKKK